MSVAMTNSVRESISIPETLAVPIDVNQPHSRTCLAISLDRCGGKAETPLRRVARRPLVGVTAAGRLWHTLHRRRCIEEEDDRGGSPERSVVFGASDELRRILRAALGSGDKELVTVARATISRPIPTLRSTLEIF
jgi:hypothetical protein